MAKVSGLLAALAAYFGLFVFGPWYASMSVQLGLGAALLGLAWARHGLRAALGSLLFVLPFVLSLLVFGAVFQWLELLGRTDWLEDSLLKAIVFPNSFLAVKLALESISFRDLVLLPLRPGMRRALVVFKAVLAKSSPLLQRYRFFMDLSPHFKGKGWPRLLRMCAVIVATYISIYQLTEQTRDLYDHRRAYLKESI